MLDVNIDTSIMYINRRCHASKITPIWHVDLRSQLLSCRVHSWNAIDCIINFVDLRLAQIKHDVSKKWMLWPPWWANSGPWPTKFSTHLFAIFPCMVNGPLLLFGFLLPHPLFYIKGGSKLWHYMAKACRAMSISISFFHLQPRRTLCSLTFGGQLIIMGWSLVLPWMEPSWCIGKDYTNLKASRIGPTKFHAMRTL